jgi:hypothetical protein
MSLNGLHETSLNLDEIFESYVIGNRDMMQSMELPGISDYVLLYLLKCQTQDHLFHSNRSLSAAGFYRVVRLGQLL